MAAYQAETETRKLNKAIQTAVSHMKPPENVPVDAWADRHRMLPANSPEPGPWDTERTPYLREIMRSFTDPKVRHIVIMAAAQVGKTEVLLNVLAYIIAQDPGTVLFVHPSLEEAQKFSKLRIAPMVRDCPVLKGKVSDAKSRDSGNTILQKHFPGGELILAGSNSPKALASVPARYLLGDERDRWEAVAGKEGDPWALAEARQSNFYNAKSVEVSTPTFKGGAIEKAYESGTRETWRHQCPDCGEFFEVTFERIRFKHEVLEGEGGEKSYRLTEPPVCVCPECGCVHTQAEMRRQPAKWVADNPGALQAGGTRSFRIRGFSSPWKSWDELILQFLKAGRDPTALQPVFNTGFGEAFEDRGDLQTEDEMLERREDYGAEVPEPVLCLTMGVDTQDDRLEYEVVGHGMFGETWGIQRGVINGDPAERDRPGWQSVWTRLDAVIDRRWKFAGGREIQISATFVDCGGHKTQEVFKACSPRRYRQVYACRGMGGESRPYTGRPMQAKIVEIVRTGGQSQRHVIGIVPRYDIGVDAGKAAIMGALKVQEPGAKYCHFPKDPERGYDRGYFTGLLSERQVYEDRKWRWKIIPGHERNEPLDCRNYAMAAFDALSPNMEELDRRRREKPRTAKKPQYRRQKQNALGGDEW